MIDLRVPEEAVPGSEKCVVNVIGEYLLSYRDDRDVFMYVCMYVCMYKLYLMTVKPCDTL